MNTMTMTASVKSKTAVTKEAVLIQLFRKQGAFNRVLKSGWRALKLGKFEQVRSTLREADAIRNEARRLRLQSNVVELESWRNNPRQLALALEKATGVRHRGNSRPVGHSTERLTAFVTQTIRKIDNLFAEMREQLAAGRSWVVLQLIAANEAILVAFAPSELVRINEAALSHLEKLERSLRDDVLHLLQRDMTKQAIELLSEERFAGCTNLVELRALVDNHMAESLVASTKRHGETGTGTRPQEHVRRGHTRRIKNKDGSVRTIEVKPHIVNKGLKRLPAQTVVLSASIPTPATLTSVSMAKHETPSSRAETVELRAVA